MKWDAQHDVPGGHVAYGSAAAPLVSVLLEPRSLLLFSHDAFWRHRHGIADVSEEPITSAVCNLGHLDAGSPYKVGDILKRARRVSLTMRHLLPRCACQG